MDFADLIKGFEMGNLSQKSGQALHVSISQFSSVAQSCLTLWDPMNCSTPGLPVHHQLPEFTHPAISSSVVPFSSCPQSPPASESFPMSQLFTRGGQSTGVSALASFLPKNTQDWSPLEWTGCISLHRGPYKREDGTSLVIQWLGLCLPMQGAQFRSLVRELRSHMPHGQKNPKT